MSSQSFIFQEFGDAEKAEARKSQIGDELEGRLKAIENIGRFTSNFAKMAKDLYGRCRDVDATARLTILASDQTKELKLLVDSVAELIKERLDLDAQIEKLDSIINPRLVRSTSPRVRNERKAREEERPL